VTIRLRAAPRGQPFDDAPTAEVHGLPGPPTIYYTQLDVAHAGDWDLEVYADGPAGHGSALIPFTVTVAPIPGTTIALFVALVGLAVLLIASILLSLIFDRREQQAPRWVHALVGQGMFACLIVAGVLGTQQFLATWQSAQAPPPIGGRPHVNIALHTDPAAPQVGQPVTLALDLTDGSTGLPVDDLVPHHEALLHLIVLDQSDSFLAHLHPARVAPGQFSIALTPDRPGRYTAYAEIQRQDSGVQIVSRDFQVAGAAVSPAAAPPGFGARELGPLQVTVSSSLMPLRAGQQATLTFNFQAEGQPVLDLQPWLGMAGHLIGRSDDDSVFMHVHADAPLPPAGPAGVGTRYGPDIRFVYTFPQPGAYRLWAQFKHNNQIVTVPLAVTVT
jgi:hypothetical protein